MTGYSSRGFSSSFRCNYFSRGRLRTYSSYTTLSFWPLLPTIIILNFGALLSRLFIRLFIVDLDFAMTTNLLHVLLQNVRNLRNVRGYL